MGRLDDEGAVLVWKKVDWRSVGKAFASFGIPPYASPALGSRQRPGHLLNLLPGARRSGSRTGAEYYHCSLGRKISPPESTGRVALMLTPDECKQHHKVAPLERRKQWKRRSTAFK